MESNTKQPLDQVSDILVTVIFDIDNQPGLTLHMAQLSNQLKEALLLVWQERKTAGGTL